MVPSTLMNLLMLLWILRSFKTIQRFKASKLLGIDHEKEIDKKELMISLAAKEFEYFDTKISLSALEESDKDKK